MPAPFGHDFLVRLSPIEAATTSLMDRAEAMEAREPEVITRLRP
jgi:hypothetical protein